MKINFTNVNFEKDINLPGNIQSLNNDIKKVCHQLPSLNIVKDINLSEYFITSKAQAKKMISDNKIFKLDEISDVGVLVRKAKGEKCSRCWKILGNLCERCKSVLKN